MGKTGKTGRPWVAVLLVAATFGPYLLTGVRTEQLAVYSLAVLGLVGARWLGRPTPSAPMLAVMALLLVEACVAIVGAALPVANATHLDRGSVVAGLDNLLLPVAVAAVAWMWCDHRHLRGTAAAVVWLTASNAVLAIASTRIDLSTHLARWWGGDVAERAAALGRHTGIFNQPTEAGAMYSIALLATIWLYRRQPWRLTAAAGLVTVGGLLSVSKVFLLIGLPVGAWQLLRAAGRSPRLAGTIATAGTAILALVATGNLPTWAGADYLTRLLHPTGSTADFYSGGRFGDGSGLWTAVHAVWTTSPWFGMGAGGVAAPYDNGWVEAFAMAGLVGVACYTAVLTVMTWAWWQRRGTCGSAFVGGLVAVCALGSVGVPVLTANRVATIVWLLAALLLFPSRKVEGVANADPRRTIRPACVGA